MRCLKLLLIGGLALGLAGPAWAFSLQGYTNGDPLVIHFNSMDASAVYKVGQHLGVAACDAATILGPAGGMAGEDAWGIARVTNITSPEGSEPKTYWSAATSQTELTAIFFGIVDQAVDFSQPLPTKDLIVSYSKGFNFMMYEDGAKNYNVDQGPLARNTVTGDYPTATDGTLLLEAKGVMGLLDSLQSTAGNPVWATHQASAGINWDLPAHNYITSVTGGSGHAFADIADADGDGFITGLGFSGSGFGTDNPLVTADIRLDWTLWPPLGTGQTIPAACLTDATTGNPVWWDLADSDPVALSYVPEPVTMAGMLLGIGCLGRYIRRRR